MTPAGTAVALVSATGAPGVTTSALLLTALRPAAVLVEADPAGGDLRANLTDPTGRPLRADLGVVSLLAAHRTASGPADRALLAHAQHLPGGLPLLIGPGSPAQADALAPSWAQLTAAIGGHAGLVLVDAGRLHQHPGSWQLVGACALTVVVTRATVPAVAHTRDLLAVLRARGVTAAVLVVGTEREHRDVTDALTTGAASPVRWVGRLPNDSDAARELLHGAWSRRLDRSPLLAGGRRAARQLHDTLHAVTSPRTDPALAAGAAGSAVPYPPEPAQIGAAT